MEPRSHSSELADLIERRELWPMTEAAYRLGLHRVTLYRLAEQGRLRLVKVGRRTFVTEAEIRRFVANLEASAS